MKKVLLSVYVWGLLVVLPACTTIQPFSYERLQAADVIFPEQVRNVGIVNCMPQQDLDEKNLDYSLGVFEGDGKVATEALAMEIAETGYFDRVVICDSVLYPKNLVSDEGWSLGEENVDSLMETLGVNLLFAMEHVHAQLKEGSMFLPELMMEVPVMDGVVTPVVKVYALGRKAPLYTVNRTDTICWELSQELTYKQIIKDVSEYAAVVTVPNFIPHWEEQYRYYFDGGNVNMRDAGVYVRERNWEEAAVLWQELYEKKNGKIRIQAAYNLAVYYEMQDDMSRAKEYLDSASSLAKENSKEARMIELYQVHLADQMKQSQRLRLQMKRFEDKK